MSNKDLIAVIIIVIAVLIAIWIVMNGFVEMVRIGH